MKLRTPLVGAAAGLAVSAALTGVAVASFVPMPASQDPAPPVPSPVASGARTLSLSLECKVPGAGLRATTLRISTTFPSSTSAGATAQVPFSAKVDVSDLTEGLAALAPAHRISAQVSVRGRVFANDGWRPGGGSYNAWQNWPAGSAPSSLSLAGDDSLGVPTGPSGLQTLRFDALTIRYHGEREDGSWVDLPTSDTDVDGNPLVSSAQSDITCRLAPSEGQDRTLGTLDATPFGPPTPTPPPGPTPIALTPSPPSSPSPTPSSPPAADFSYALQGSTTLATLTKGTMPLTGSVDASLTLSTGDFTADLKLNPTQGRLTALGFLPVTATVGFVTSGPTTGKLVDDQLSTNSKVRIKVTSVKAFGAIPLAGGNTCQTKSLSDISLKSTDSFDPTTRGGTIGGSYAISDLNGCGPLNGLVSPITAGKGNTISLKLTPVR